MDAHEIMSHVFSKRRKGSAFELPEGQLALDLLTRMGTVVKLL